MQAGNKIALLKAKIHELTHGGADYYAKHLKALKIDEGAYFSYATTHPTIPGNESFLLELMASEWHYTYYNEGSSYHGDVIDFYRLVHGLDDQTSEYDILCLINDEMELGLTPIDKLIETDVVHASSAPNNTVESVNPAVDTIDSIVEDTSVQTTYSLVAVSQVTEYAVEKVDERDQSSEPPTELPVVPSIISKCDGTTVSHATSDVLPMSVSGEQLDDDNVETEFEVQSENDATGDQDSESDQEPDPEPKRNKPGVGFVSALDLLNMEITEVPSLVKPLLPLTGLAAVVGSSDSGKSTFSRQLAIAICSGDEEFLGFGLLATRGRVIYVSTEDDLTATAALLTKQFGSAMHDNRVLDNLTYLFDTKNITKRLDTELSNYPADLVICDSYMDLFDKGDSNSNNQVRQFLDGYASLAQKHRCLFLFVHHTGKRTDGNEPSKHNVIGSQGFEARMRVVLDIRQHDANRRLLSPVKGNYLGQATKSKSFVLEFDEQTLTFSMTNDQVGFSPATKNRVNKQEYVVDWPSLFGADRVLKRNILIQRLDTTYDMPSGTADAYINKELEKVTGKTGFHRMKSYNKPEAESGPTIEPDKPELGSENGSDNKEP